MALLSPGIQVNVNDKSIYTTSTARTIPLFFIATKYGKTQPNSNVLALGSIESGVPRFVTSLKESISLYGMPIFYKDVYGQQNHGDARNEFGLLALNQFLKSGAGAYVIRADIDLDDNVENLKLLWEEATTKAINVAKNLASSYILGKFNDGLPVATKIIAQSPKISSDYIEPETGFIKYSSTIDPTLKTYYTEEYNKYADINALHDIIDASVEEFKKSTASFRDKYTLLSNKQFNLTNILSGNYYSVDVSNYKDGNNYPVYLSKPFLYNAANDKNEAARQLLSDMARGINKDLDIPFDGNLINPKYPEVFPSTVYESSAFLGMRGLLSKELNNATIYKCVNTLDISKINALFTGNIELTLDINKLYDASSSADPFYYGIGQISAVEQLDTNGDSTVKKGNFTYKIIATVDKTIVNGKELTTSLYKFDSANSIDYFKNVNDVTISIYGDNNGDIEYIGKIQSGSSDSTIAAMFEFKPLAPEVLTVADVNTKINTISGGINLTKFVKIVTYACSKYLYTRSWWYSCNKTFYTFNEATNNTTAVSPFLDNTKSKYATDAQRRQEIVKKMAQMINAQSSKDTNVEMEYSSDITADGYFYNIVLAPGYPELADELIKLSEAVQQEVYVIGDCPLHMSPVDLIRWGQRTDESSVVSTGDNIRVDDRGLISYFYPHGLVRNLDGANVVLPSSALALVAFNNNDKIGELWTAPAGVNRGQLVGLMDIVSTGYVNAKGYNDQSTLGTSDVSFETVRLNQVMRDSLYHNCNINPITNDLQTGISIFGNKNRVTVNRQMIVDGSMQTVTASALDRINVSRLIMYIRRGVKLLLKGYLFEINDARTRKTISATVNSFLNDIKARNGLYDFAVLCDDSNNTPATIDAYELYIQIALKPTKVLEFIYVDINVVKTGDEMTF